MTIFNSTLRENSVVFDGGALYISSSEDIKVFHAIIKENIANDNGGGVYISRSS